MDSYHAVERFRQQLDRKDIDFVFANLGRGPSGLVWIVTAMVKGYVTTRHVVILGRPYDDVVIDEAAERFAQSVLSESE